jgi:hypothetical protein
MLHKPTASPCTDGQSCSFLTTSSAAAAPLVTLPLLIATSECKNLAALADFSTLTAALCSISSSNSASDVGILSLMHSSLGAFLSTQIDLYSFRESSIASNRAWFAPCPIGCNK